MQLINKYLLLLEIFVSASESMITLDTKGMGTKLTITLNAIKVCLMTKNPKYGFVYKSGFIFVMDRQMDGWRNRQM